MQGGNEAAINLGLAADVTEAAALAVLGGGVLMGQTK